MRYAYLHTPLFYIRRLSPTFSDFEVEELAFVGLEGKLSSTRRQDGRVSTRLISGIVRLRPYKRSGSFQKTDLVLSLFSENDTPSVQILKF